MDHEIINLCETVQQKSVWINFFSIFHDSEEQRENMVYNEPKQTNIVPISVSTHWCNLFHDLSF